MNWIKKTLRIGEKIKRLINKHRPTKEEMEKSDWTSCCKGPILKKDLEDNLWCCNLCGKHHRINSRQRFDVFFGKENYEILKTPMPIDDPISWKDTKPYTKRLKDARKKNDQECGVLIAKGKINNIELVCAAMNFNFIGGSMGTAEGEAIISGIQHSIDNSIPFVIFTSTGGARMMESGLSLMQMTRTVLAVNELKNKKLPYIVCMCSPTSGGVTASFAMLGDIQIAEPGAEIIFAGRRVIESTIKEELPENFQTAEHTMKCGFVDTIIARKDLPKKIGTLLSILLNKNSEVNSTSENETSENTQQLSKVAS